MSFEKIIGQPLAVKLLQRWLARKTTQPLVFYGPEGVGKRTLAIETAQALNCHQTPHAESCGACLNCKKVAGGKHADVHIVDLAYQALVREEPIEKQQSLRIETLLEERKRLYQTPTEGPWKVSLIDDAHRLTPDAANVLLKILEEPPERTAIFLVTPFRDRLFATILSRCQPVRFRSLSDSDMEKVLSQRGTPQPTPGSYARLIELAAGSPGRALHLNRQEQIQAAVEAETLLERLPGMTPAAVLSTYGLRSRNTAANRAEVESQIDLLLTPALRELRSNPRLEKRKVAAKVELLQHAQQQLRQNVPPALVYGHLLLKLSEVLS